MHIQSVRVAEWAKGNWFFIAAALLVLCDLSAMSHVAASSPKLLEAAILADFAVVVPCLYLICYRRKGKKALFRAVWLACLGIWAASKLIPAETQHWVTYLWPLRYAGLAALFLLEAKVLMTVYRALFGGATVEQASAVLQERADMPAWLARWVVLEAAFWRRVVGVLAKIFRVK
ncbi:hypothetical protein BH11PSE8_BH11PSE8_35000 [soil metagenome]